MNTNKKNKRQVRILMLKVFSYLLPLTSYLFLSCVDTVILPDNKTVDEDYWQKKSEVDAVVATAYAQLRDASSHQMISDTA